MALLFWTLETSGNGFRFAPLYDLRLYLPATSGFALCLRDLFNLLIAFA